MVRIVSLMGIMVFLCGMLLAGQPMVHAASEDWQTPQRIPGLVDSGSIQYPYFIADPSGKLHVFHSQWVRERLSIVYSSWIEGVGWTNPIDVITSPYEEARIVGAFLDRSGIMNIFFWGGNDQSAAIYYTKASLQSVGNSKAWTQPIIVGNHAIAPATAAVVSDAQGSVVLVYSGNEEGNGLYSVISQDGGKTWMKPSVMYFAASDNLWPSALQMILASNGKVHAVWGLGDVTGNSLRIYHAAFDPGLEAWGKPTVLAEALEAEADTPSIIEHNGSLIVIYHNNFPTTRWMIRSSDSGKSWTPPTRLFEHVGSNGAAALVIDSSNTLHMFFGNRLSGSPDIHGLWHSVWQEGDWSVPEAVVSGPLIEEGVTGEEGFDPINAQSVIIQGNLLLVAWRHDPPVNPIHIWFSYTYLDVPQLPTATAVWLPSPTAEPAVEALPMSQIETPVPAIPDDVPMELGGGNLGFILAVGVTPALILILAIIIFKRKPY